MVVADDRYIAPGRVQTLYMSTTSLATPWLISKMHSLTLSRSTKVSSNTLLTWNGHAWWEGVIELPDPSPGIQEAKERDDTVVVSLEMVNQRLIPTADRAEGRSCRLEEWLRLGGAVVELTDSARRCGRGRHWHLVSRFEQGKSCRA